MSFDIDDNVYFKGGHVTFATFSAQNTVILNGKIINGILKYLCDLRRTNGVTHQVWIPENMLDIANPDMGGLKKKRKPTKKRKSTKKRKPTKKRKLSKKHRRTKDIKFI